MENYFEILQKCSLFHGIIDENLTTMLNCFGANVVTYKKKETILAEGESPKYIGIVLSGKVQMIQIDYFGNRSIVATITSSELFGESFACANIKALPVNIIAAEDTKVMFIDCMRITQSCSNACIFHNQIIYNLMKGIATKNLMFHQKIEVTSKRTTREKLMTYLLLQAKKQNSNQFYISYDRQELADYLEVDRSGLSAEISKLKKEGILDSKKNLFILLKDTIS